VPISPDVKLGQNVVIFHPDLVNLYGCTVGDESKIATFVEIQRGVVIGKRVKVEAFAFIPSGVTIEDGVFIGPHVCFTNDKVPRAVNADMTLKGVHDWKVTPTRVKAGAALGANSTIVCGTTIGKWAMVGSGSVVTKDVPDHALVLGNPARFVAWVCACGERVTIDESTSKGTCTCGRVLVKSEGRVQLA
jgi:acetyltransferase-like isoleucine patch superfamily enzyme